MIPPAATSDTLAVLLGEVQCLRVSNQRHAPLAGPADGEPLLVFEHQVVEARNQWRPDHRPQVGQLTQQADSVGRHVLSAGVAERSLSRGHIRTRQCDSQARRAAQLVEEFAAPEPAFGIQVANRAVSVQLLARDYLRPENRLLHIAG